MSKISRANQFLQRRKICINFPVRILSLNASQGLGSVMEEGEAVGVSLTPSQHSPAHTFLSRLSPKSREGILAGWGPRKGKWESNYSF